MKKTLLLRLAGPMQSWGANSRFTYRETGLEPSKSGVIGLICAALGKPRGESKIEDDEFRSLVELRMGVRIDRPGVMLVDYHTVGGRHLRDEANYGVLKADGKISDQAVVSHRFYLADAKFIVGLESENEKLLKKIHRHLRQPRWQLCLGRKAFVPSEPVWLRDEEWPQGLQEGICSLGLRQALQQFPWPQCNTQTNLRVVLEPEPEARDVFEARHDLPLCFEKGKRQFTVRYVKTEWVSQVGGNTCSYQI